MSPSIINYVIFLRSEARCATPLWRRRENGSGVRPLLVRLHVAVARSQFARHMRVYKIGGVFSRNRDY